MLCESSTWVCGRIDARKNLLWVELQGSIKPVPKKIKFYFPNSHENCLFSFEFTLITYFKLMLITRLIQNRKNYVKNCAVREKCKMGEKEM
jgi:hypothetical protein